MVAKILSTVVNVGYSSNNDDNLHTSNMTGTLMFHNRCKVKNMTRGLTSATEVTLAWSALNTRAEAHPEAQNKFLPRLIVAVQPCKEQRWCGGGLTALIFT